MPTFEEIELEKERLWESSPLRDDIDDNAAELLLQWSESQIDVMAERFPDDFEQGCRSFRQLVKAINRFVGQREFLITPELYDKYMSKVMLWLPKVGYDTTQTDIEANLPVDPKDLKLNIQAVIDVINATPAVASKEDLLQEEAFTDDGAPVDQTPIDDASVNEAPAEEAFTDDGAPVDQTPIDNASVNEAPAEEAFTDDGAPISEETITPDDSDDWDDI